MKISVAAAAFVGVTLLVGGQAAYSLAGDELNDTPVVTDPSVTEPEAEEPEVEEPETEQPGGSEAAAEHREAMAAWKDCVDAAVEAAPEATEPIDVLAPCGTKPHPPGKANGWDGEKVSKNAQKKVDKAAGVEKEHKAKPEKAAKAPKSKKGKGHQG